MSEINDWTNDIHRGDAADTLAELPESSIHMCMTSPPYFGLRDYGVAGQIGLEDELDEYIAELVEVFREVRRVLRPDGSAWLNLGDSYASKPVGNYNGGETHAYSDDRDEAHASSGQVDKSEASGLARKNKMLVPHRVAIALQEDGWIVRNDVTWAKPNPMPSSVKDRLNTTTEQVFHLVPEPDYWYDLDAIREKHAASSYERDEYGGRRNYASENYGHGTDPMGGGANENMNYHPAGKNPGDVFEVTTKPFPEAHFAVYPPELVEKPLKATCPPKVCAECGSPYERDVERESITDAGRSDDAQYVESGTREEKDAHRQLGGNYQEALENRDVVMKGWTPTCDCDTDATEAGIALDPFAGAGTTALVAKRHGRRFVGIDLNEEYVAMAQKRLGLTVDHPEHVREEGQAGIEMW